MIRYESARAIPAGGSLNEVDMTDEEMKVYQKKYREKNREKLNKYRKEYKKKHEGYSRKYYQDNYATVYPHREG